MPAYFSAKYDFKYKPVCIVSNSKSGTHIVRFYTQTYTGSMVPDIHRIILQGGLFVYPATKDKPCGKLRLSYECNPMAFIIETAGGKAIDGNQQILEIEPLTLHQRTPFFAGSREMVDELLSHIT